MVVVEDVKFALVGVIFATALWEVLLSDLGTLGYKKTSAKTELASHTISMLFFYRFSKTNLWYLR